MRLLNVGTKSVLFGVHAFWLHPFYVYWGWKLIHKRRPNAAELCAIITHDLGYWGCPDMDGDIGETHPERVAKLWRKYFPGKFGKQVSTLILGHSSYYTARHNLIRGDLYSPDKLATGLYPTWLYMLLGTLSGELDEYINCCRFGKYMREGASPSITNRTQWVMIIQANCTLKAFKEWGTFK